MKGIPGLFRVKLRVLARTRFGRDEEWRTFHGYAGSAEIAIRKARRAAQREPDIFKAFETETVERLGDLDF